MPDPFHSEFSQAFRKASPYLNMGYVLIGSIALFGFIGNQTDHWLDSKPVGLIIGLFTGLALGFYHLIKAIQQIENKKP